MNREEPGLPAEPCIAVVGCGYWGKNLLRNFAQIGQLYGFYDGDPARVQSFAAQYPQARGFAAYTAVLEDPRVRGVVLATPAQEHHAMAAAALRAGKDVFVEKPLALNVEEGSDLVDIARSAGRILMVGHLLQYHPAVQKMLELLGSGVLGKVEYAYSNRLSMGKIRREENALWSFAPHDISVLLRLTCSLPLQVTATGGAYLQPNIADVTVSNLLFDHGVRAHIFVSWLHPYKEQRLVVIGSKQMIVFEDSRPNHKLLLYDKRIEFKDGGFEAGKSEATPVDFAPDEPLRLECRHFVECVVSRQPPRTPGEEGLQVLQVLQACQRSLQMNGEPVQLSATRLQPLRSL